MAQQRYRVSEVLAALKSCGGYIYLSAEKLGCDIRTVQRYIARYPTLREAADQIRGRRVDVGEAALDKAVEAGEGWAIKYLLSTQGRDRGYIERQEHQIDIPALQAEIRGRLGELANRGAASPPAGTGSAGSGNGVVNGTNGHAGPGGAAL